MSRLHPDSESDSTYCPRSPQAKDCMAWQVGCGQKARLPEQGWTDPLPPAAKLHRDFLFPASDYTWK